MSRKLRKTNEQFIKELHDVHGDEYTPLEEYQGVESKITIRHNKCGNTYKVAPYSLLRGRGCPDKKCVGEKISNKKIKCKGEFTSQMYALVKDDYVMIGEYINRTTKVKIKHLKCGHIYQVIPRNFLQGTRCPYCSGNKKKITIEFKKEIYDLVGNEYELLDKYKNNSTKVKMKHNYCNKNYYVKPSDFLSGRRCPHCRESKGEKSISKTLDYNNINYVPQYLFDDCIYKDKLKFDFAIFNNKNELILLIEYDGEQHFKSVDFANKGEEWSKSEFIKNKKKDRIKNTYCITNNIPLIRIPYWEFNNIEYILQNVLKHFKLINNKNNTYDKGIVNKYLVDSEWDHDTYLSWNDKDKRNIPMKRELIHN